MHFNFKEEVIPNKTNFFITNPINKKDTQSKKINGKYIYETFYLIDFLDIKDDTYIISSFGRLFSLVTKEEINVVMDKTKDNYRAVMLKTNSGKRRKFPLHRLVARAFIPKTDIDKKMKRVYIHHKNWDNDCNFYWNLEWRSPLEIMMMDRIKENAGDEKVITEVVHRLIERGETIDDIYYMIDEQLSKFKIFAIRRRLKRNKK